MSWLLTDILRLLRVFEGRDKQPNAELRRKAAEFVSEHDTTIRATCKTVPQYLQLISMDYMKFACEPTLGDYKGNVEGWFSNYILTPELKEVMTALRVHGGPNSLHVMTGGSYLGMYLVAILQHFHAKLGNIVQTSEYKIAPGVMTENSPCYRLLDLLADIARVLMFMDTAKLSDGTRDPVVARFQPYVKRHVSLMLRFVMSKKVSHQPTVHT